MSDAMWNLATIDERLAQLWPLYKRRGYSFDQAFDAVWRRMMREAGMTRVEIARANFAFPRRKNNAEK
jgi:hypothetical protein